MVSTILFCLDSSVAVFVIARVLQGGSSAITWTAGLTLLVDTVGQDRLGKVMGFCSMGMNGALLLSPFVGGLVLDKSGYTSVFTITFVIIVVDLVLRILVVEKAAAQHPITKPPTYWIIKYSFHGTPSISSSPGAEIEDFEAPLLRLYKDFLFLEQDSTHTRWRKSLPPLLSLLQFQRLRVLL